MLLATTTSVPFQGEKQTPRTSMPPKVVVVADVGVAAAVGVAVVVAVVVGVVVVVAPICFVSFVAVDRCVAALMVFASSLSWERIDRNRMSVGELGAPTAAGGCGFVRDKQLLEELFDQKKRCAETTRAD